MKDQTHKIYFVQGQIPKLPLTIDSFNLDTKGFKVTFSGKIVQNIVRHPLISKILDPPLNEQAKHFPSEGFAEIRPNEICFPVSRLKG